MLTRTSHRPLARPSTRALALALLAALGAATGPAEAQAPTETLRLDQPDVVASTLVGGASDRGHARLMGVATGDLNGDGLEDMVIGAPGHDVNGLAAGGSVYVIFGRADLFNDGDERDLSALSAFDVRIDSDQRAAQLGTRVAIDDVDGDGIDDLVMSAPGRAGAVYVKRGGQGAWPRGVVSLSDEVSHDVVFAGVQEASMLGAVLCLGDLDGDRRADLVFGGLEYDDQGYARATALYVLPGRPRWSSRRYTLDQRIPGRVRLARSVGSRSRAMHTCALGDVDGDGSGDVIAGMPLDSVGGQEGLGSVAIVRDVLARSVGSIDLGEERARFGARLVGDQPGGHFGHSLAVADFNGDGLDDLAIGAPDRSLQAPTAGAPDDAPRPSGAVFVFWGRVISGEAGVDRSPDLVLVGSPGSQHGASLDVSDYNGDGRADLAVGAPGAEGFVGHDAGAVAIYLGVNEALAFGLRESERDGTTHALTLMSDTAGARLGHDLAAADLDGDGSPEWLMRSTVNARRRERAGSVHVLRSPTRLGRAQLMLGEGQSLTLIGPGRGGSLTTAVNVNDDLDGDGRPDQVWISSEGAGMRGVACVQLSSAPARTGTLSIMTGAACDLQILTPPGSRLSDLDAGDFDGDGALELAIGMEDHPVNAASVGAVAVIELPGAGVEVLDLGGSSEGQWWWLGGEGAEGLGVEVELVDLDGDGAAELVAAAGHAVYDDQQGAGALLIFRGGAGVAPQMRNAARGEGIWMKLIGRAGGQLGPGSRVLDFDGDGTMDLLAVASADSMPGRARSGIGYLIYHVARLGEGLHVLQDERVTTTRIVGPGEGSLLTHPADPTDLDGDGRADLMLLSPGAEGVQGRRGAAYVIYGRAQPLGPLVDLGATGGSDLVVYGERFGGALMGPVAGDLDGDGAAELVLSVGLADSAQGLPEAGRAHVLRGTPGEPFKGEVLLDVGEASRWIFEGVEAHGGLSVPRALPDLDGDGVRELWLISPFADGLYSDQGRAYQIAPAALGRP